MPTPCPKPAPRIVNFDDAACALPSGSRQTARRVRRRVRERMRT
jgi:hypothetical protein